MTRVLCPILALFTVGCTMLQPNSITVHAVYSEPSPHAKADAGGNFKASVAAAADVGALAVVKNCTVCVLARTFRDVFHGGFGVGADLAEGNRNIVSRTALPVEPGVVYTVRTQTWPDGRTETCITPTLKLPKQGDPP